MRIRRLITIGAAAAFITAAATGVRAERLVTSLSNYRVLITSNFTGTDLVLFGSVERDAATVARRGGYDIVATVTGPRQGVVTRRKQRVLGIWVNIESRTFIDAPTYLAVRANRPLAEIASPEMRDKFQVGLDALALSELASTKVAEAAQNDPFRTAFIRLKTNEGLFRERDTAITFLTPNLFRATIPIPANVPIGTYEIDVKLFSDGVIIARDSSAFEIVKVGFEQFVATAAHDHGALYGVATAGMALLIGFFASVVFRRD
jgi:uncharacterized protein (TIGR02186 family)